MNNLLKRRKRQRRILIALMRKHPKTRGLVPGMANGATLLFVYPTRRIKKSAKKLQEIQGKIWNHWFNVLARVL